MASFLLGIDLGSTSIKAILYDELGKLLARAMRPMRRHHPNPQNREWTVWNPVEILEETASAVCEAVSQISDPSEIRGIATTGMGMDGLPMSEEGEPLYPLISWHDTRTQPQYDWWIDNIGAEKTYSIGGNPVWAINSALRMLWVKENEPEIYSRTYKWLLIEDFFNHFLTGRFATDYSMASCTMLFDQRKRAWSNEMCELSGIRPDILPEALPSSSFLGGVSEAAAKRTGLVAGTPVFLGGHDHICGSLPVGAFRPGTVMNITGTWETVGLVGEEPPLSTPLGKSGITVQAHVAPDVYMIWGGNPSGEMIEWYRRELAASLIEEHRRRPINWEIMVREAASSPPGCNGVLFLPHLSGSSCPEVDPRSRGSFVGLDVGTSHSSLIRSIIEGLDFQLKRVLETMESGLSTGIREIVAVGGAIRNSFWMQNKADVTGLEVHVSEVEEATVLGASILAGVGAGIYRDFEDAFERTSAGTTVFKPDPKLCEYYAGMYPVFEELYSSLAPLHHRLAEFSARTMSASK